VAPKTRTKAPVFARPYVFAVQGHPLLDLNHEVSTARWVPLATFADPGILRDFTLEIGGVERTFPAYHLDEGTVWGMTERILTSFLDLITEPQP
jgi:hypothetical protein